MDHHLCGFSGFKLTKQQSKSCQLSTIDLYERWMLNNAIVLSAPKVRVLQGVLEFAKKNLVGHGFFSNTDPDRFRSCSYIVSISHWQDALFAFAVVQELQMVKSRSPNSSFVKEIMPKAIYLWENATVVHKQQLNHVAMAVIGLALVLGFFGREFICLILLICAIATLAVPEIAQIYVDTRFARALTHAKSKEVGCFLDLRVNDGLDADIQSVSQVAQASKQRLVQLALAALGTNNDTLSPPAYIN